MGRSVKGNRKGREQKKKKKKKKKKRELRLRQVKAKRAQASSWKVRMQRTGRFPLLECRINAGFRESGLAQVMIAREGPEGIAIGFFLVDLGCLGVKNCMLDDQLSQEEYDRLVANVERMEPFVPCDAALAVKVVEAGVRYAAELDFRPHPDYAAARGVFGDIDPGECREDVPCGRDGQPVYVEGPDDDTAGILRRLEARLGPDGFGFVAVAGPNAEELAEEEFDFPDEDDPDPAERQWGRMRRAEGRLVGAILKHVADRHGRKFMKQAHAEFDPDGPSGPTDDGIFVSWALFNWTPSRRRTLLGESRVRTRPVALEFLAENEGRLDAFDRKFLETICRRPFSFYVVESVDVGRFIELRDLFSGRTYRVREQQASTMVETGTILFARVLSMDSVAILVGCAPLVIPPMFRIDLIDLREELAGEEGLLAEEHLGELDGTLRETYRTIADRIHHPPAPSLQNTDGEPLLLGKVIFDLRCTPEEAAAKLRELALEWTDEDFEREGIFDASGQLESIEFPWTSRGNRVHESWDNTVLGHLEIRGNELVAEVNSEARARRLRREVERLLGERAVWRTTESESPDALSAEARARGPRAESESDRARAAVGSDPFARAQLETMLANHWESWPDAALPALGGKSPREAARTAAGRERLEALLCDMTSRTVEEDMLRPDIESLRRELGLLDEG